MSAQSGPDVAALLCTRAHGMRHNHKSRVTPCSHCQADAQVIREAYAKWLTGADACEFVRLWFENTVTYDTFRTTPDSEYAEALTTTLADLLREQA